MASLPADGIYLVDLGFRHSPAGFSVPASSVVTTRVDQKNVVTLMFASPDSASIAAYLRTNLSAMGFRITGDKDDSLVFESEYYDGAFTAAGGVTGLTLRRVER